MEKRIWNFIREHHMIEPQDRIVVGVSGGADSVCLLFLLLALQKKISFALSVVHINHQLRGEEAKRDENYVKTLCKEKQLACKVYSFPVLQLAKEQKTGLEEMGRMVRYQAFEEWKKEWKGTKIALAHHQNDLAETMLYHLARGTGIAGLCSIRPIRGEFIRPLLCMTRQEVEQYLENNHIDYMTDSTNLSTDYTRNKIRHEILPVLEEQINEKTINHMAQTAEYMAELQEYISEQVKEKSELYFHGGEELFVTEEMFQEPVMIQGYLIREAIERSTHQKKDISAKHVEYIREMREKQVGSQIHLPHGIVVKKTYKGMIFSAKNEQEESIQSKENQDEICLQDSMKESIALGWKKKYQTEDIELELSLEEGNLEGIEEKIYTKWFDYDKLNSRLCLRHRKTGDYLVVREDGATKKIKDYFINEKIPREQREEIWLLTDGSCVLWVLGYRISEYYKVTEHTKRMLKVQLRGGNDHGSQSKSFN